MIPCTPTGALLNLSVIGYVYKIMHVECIEVTPNPDGKKFADHKPRAREMGRGVRSAHATRRDRVVRRLRGGAAAPHRSRRSPAAILIPLNQEKRPNCYLHRSNPNDVARTEQLTFVCTPTKEEAGPTNNWSEPAATYAKLRRMVRRLDARAARCTSMPYVMGPLGSPLSKVGVEITDSIYVALSMRIMTRMGAAALEQLGDVRRFQQRTALHARPESRAAADLSFSAGQHDLVRRQRLRRQRAAEQEMLRAANRELARPRRRMARRAHAHLGMQDPEGETTYIAAAFPSACGKTNLAMLHAAGWQSRAGKFSPSATTSRGCGSDPTAACGRSIRRTDTSASRRAPARNRISTR